MAPMKDQELRNLVTDQSPWRRDPNWRENDRDLRYAAQLPLDYQPDPLGDIEPGGLYVLRGPRRVGKSLELKRAISRLISNGVDPKVILHCTCDGLTQQDLRRLITQGLNETRT